MQEQGTDPKNKREKAQDFYAKLKNKYRLVVMNDQTFEEQAAWRITPLNSVIFILASLIGLVVLTIYIVAFTPIREYIPGYADVNMQRTLVGLTLKTDSMERQLQAQELFITNMNAILTGDEMPGEVLQAESPQDAKYDTIQELERSPEDSILRAEMESEDKFALNETDKTFASNLQSFHFFTPLKGTVTAGFERTTGHYGVDIVSAPNQGIKSTLPGTVIFSDYTSEAGYTVSIQHSNELISMYKHNSALLKSVGSYVKAGDVVAIIGNSGEFTTGPHLHFEIWYNGTAVDPQQFMSF
ncbi:MAG: M23 family metallopeptidase [Bacteroidia bacterium]|nr:M23 family metallopeptidase [Bacteroidia bacterium]NNC85349.1 M23 family metallopeptidase [Bacteroidia bacterium]NNM16517.1 M23 family metallopeptidase [Bacteroidia bacterium]